MIFKQAVAYTHQFLMVLSSDHVSGATGKTVAVELGKNGATGTGAQFSPATEVDPTNLPGIYSILLSANDVNSLSELNIHATASGCDPTDEVCQVQFQVFPDVQLATNGRALIASTLQQNAACNAFLFSMTNAATGQLMTGLTVTAQRSLAGASFAPCTNPVTEITGTGTYSINLSQSDLNAQTVGLMFTASGANQLNIPLIPTP